MWTRTDIDFRAGHTVVIVFNELHLSFTLIKRMNFYVSLSIWTIGMERRFFNDWKSACSFRQLEYQVLFVNLTTIHLYMLDDVLKLFLHTFIRSIFITKGL